ncbi:MAG: CoA transferase [Burkholderiales bacterium]|nr:CoA transferase [Burkholderiales bacterium]
MIEFGAAAAIAYAGKLFRDLGAQTTRVEAEGVARDLLARARIVLCGASGGENAPGLPPLHLAREFPHLVVVSVTPFGVQGGARDLPADDLTLQAWGGISIGIGSPGKPPLKLPGDQSACQAGLAAAIAAMGVLFSDRGALIDVAAADVWAAFYSGVDVALAHFGRYGKSRAGHRVFGQPYPRTIFRCRNGYFAIQCGESRHWLGFLRMIGREDLLAHPLFADRFRANDLHGEECDALIEPWFLARTKDEILRQCLEHRIPGAPVYDLREVAGHAHLRERGYFIETETTHGRTRLPGNPYSKLVTSPAGKTVSPPAPAHPGRAASKLRPLAGRRVVDFGWVWAGAVPGHVLADMGAQVIKVESASPLDYMRQGPPIVGTKKDPEQNPMFQNVNRGKLSLRMKLDHPDARSVLKDLVAASDVVIENFSPGVMEKFGLCYRELRTVHPGLVMCSMSAAGQDGPLRGIRTYATMIAGLAGLDGLVGYPGERVLGSQSSYADPNASLHAVLGILAALWRRERTGEGAYIDLSQWEAAVGVMAGEFSRHASHDGAPAPQGTRHPRKVPHGNYPAAGEDRWIAISISTDAQWQAMARVFGGPDWMSRAAFTTAAQRRANSDELDRRLGEETARHDANALASALASAGVSAAPLLDAPGIAASSHFRERQLFEMVEHPVLGPLPVYRLPWHIDGAPLPVTRRAPLLGEHNRYVLGDILGYPDERISALDMAGLFS